MVATTLNGSGLFQYEQRLGDPDPFRNFLEVRFWTAPTSAEWHTVASALSTNRSRIL
jgi:hypothetical protein